MYLFFIYIIFIVVLTFFISYLLIKKIVKKGETIFFSQIYDYHKQNGYLKTCQSGNYKFSSSLLENLIKKHNKDFKELDIKDLEEALTIPGVGKKVYELIVHLVVEYQRSQI